MPAKSKAQQRYFGMVRAGKIKKPKGMSDEDVEKMASTKHKGLPDRVEEDYDNDDYEPAKNICPECEGGRFPPKEGEVCPRCKGAGEVYESMKDLIGGMTFSTFLIVEQEADTSTVRGYIRSLPIYQEMLKDQEVKGQALKLARSMVDEFGDGPVDSQTQDYIFDQFDELSQQTYKGRTQIGDWKGEEEYQRKQREEKDIESAIDKWEQTTGMSAETGEDLPKRRMHRGATHQAGKFAKARAEMRAFQDAPSPEQATRLATARTRAQAAGAPARGEKMTAAREIFNQDFGEKRPSEIINRMVNEVGMSKPHATTYYYKFKKAAR